MNADLFHRINLINFIILNFIILKDLFKKVKKIKRVKLFVTPGKKFIARIWKEYLQANKTSMRYYLKPNQLAN